MKAKLIFNLPEDAEDHKYALKGLSYKIALDEMDNYLRSRLKYEDLSEEIDQELQAARDKLNELIRDATE